MPLSGGTNIFNELKKVQILRFVELCEQYGYRGGSGSRIAPIDEWETDDREEMTELLERLVYRCSLRRRS
jgi:hypothetical protein